MTIRHVPEHRIKTLSYNKMLPRDFKVTKEGKELDYMAAVIGHEMGMEMARKLIEFNKIKRVVHGNDVYFRVSIEVIVPETPK